jgi:hypothetical protein
MRVRISRNERGVTANPSSYPKDLLDSGLRLEREGERPIGHVAQELWIPPTRWVCP